MTNPKKPIVTSTVSIAPDVTTESLIQTARMLDEKHVSNVRNLCAGLGGIKIIPDLSGFMVGQNEYAVIVGLKLYEKLRKANGNP